MESNTTYLIIDDNEADRMMAAIMLTNVLKVENLEYAVDGEDGIEWLLNNKKNLNGRLIILLDIFMPKMDGFEFMETFTQFHRDLFDRTTIYMLTSSINKSDQEKAEKYSIIKEFINKPLSKDKVSLLV